MKNKRGWIRIVEAFVAILLIAGTLLIVINKGYIGKKDISKDVYEIETSILREIELNDGLRAEILNVEPIPTEDTTYFPEVNDRIQRRIPDYLECKAKICKMNEICVLDNLDIEKEIYAQSVAISASLDTYNPRQLRLFCWER